MAFLRKEKFTRKEELAPDFFGRITEISSGLPPFRVYIHNSGANGAFGHTGHSPEALVLNHLHSILRKSPNAMIKGPYLLATAWGQEGDQMMDLFRYDGISDWPGNPGVRAFSFKNGVYRPEEREVTCGDGLRILGREEESRRKTKDLIDYMEHPPEIEGLTIV